MITEAAKRIFNSDKICRSYSDLNFGVTFFGTQCTSSTHCKLNARLDFTFVCAFYCIHFRITRFNDCSMPHFVYFTLIVLLMFSWIVFLLFFCCWFFQKTSGFII